MWLLFRRKGGVSYDHRHEELWMLNNVLFFIRTVAAMMILVCYKDHTIRLLSKLAARLGHRMWEM